MTPSNSDTFSSTTDEDSGYGVSRRPSATGHNLLTHQNVVNNDTNMQKVSSISSFDSIDQDLYFSDAGVSDDLDKLSTCLTEVSDDDDNKKSGVITDLIQAQLAFWTLVFSFLYSYVWLQHRKKFLLTIFFAVPVVLIVCFTIAWLLGAIVIMSRIFHTSLKIEQMLKFNSCNKKEVERRRRSLSNASRRSSISLRSSLCEELPKPVCRKHSTSNNSLNQIHILTNGHSSSGAVSPISGRLTPTSPLYKKATYSFAHQSADDDYET